MIADYGFTVRKYSLQQQSSRRFQSPRMDRNFWMVARRAIGLQRIETAREEGASREVKRMDLGCPGRIVLILASTIRR